jgi:hypothetical protein
MSTTTTQLESESAYLEPEKQYGWSVLFTSLGRMWRGWAPALTIIIVNAVLQALLVMWNPIFGIDGVGVYALAAASGLLLLMTVAVLTATALLSVDSRVGVGAAMARAASAFGTFALWMISLWIIVMVGYSLWTLPGIFLLAITPFVSIAAIDGQRNAFMANLKAISARPIRWLFTVLIIGAISGILWVLSAFNTFFITGFWSSLFACLSMGMFCWWFQTAWARLYRSTPVGVTDAPQADQV